MSIHEINTLSPACFIERAGTVRKATQIMISRWLELVSDDQSHQLLNYSTYIKTEIVNADNNPALWSAITASQHIWFASDFIGESAALFTRLIDKAAHEQVTNKKVFNWAERGTSIYYLSSQCQHISERIDYLEKKQHIQFYFWDDICRMMYKRPDNRGDPTALISLNGLAS